MKKWNGIIDVNATIDELYVVRHGQTDYNLNRIVQGRGVDGSLNEKGKKQAGTFYEAYQNVKFDGLYASSLARSRETIAAFAKPELPVRTFAHLDEISWGEHEGKTPNEAMSADYYRVKASWEVGDFTIRVNGGESPREVWERLSEFLHFLHQQNHKRALICSHGRTSAILLCMLLNEDLRNMEQYRLKNTGLSILKGNANAYELHLHNHRND